jgi:hypothetical protein
MRLACASALTLACTIGFAQAISPTNRDDAKAALIPYPQIVDWKSGNNVRLTSLKIEGGDQALRAQAAWFLAEEGVRVSESSRTTLVLRIGELNITTIPDSAYELTIGRSEITITAPNAKAHFYALQNLRQLAGTAENGGPQCRIVDWPEFPMRGFMHDLGRNPQDVETLKSFIDVMAQYKLTIFHLHLTDRPGWRIESKAFPELNAKSAYRETRRPGFFYTYDELREIIAYAKRRHVQILPEIDMPGHSDFFDTVFGFGMQDPRGVEILKKALTEFFNEISVEDVPLFHMGSDEVRLTNPDFMDEISGHIRAHDRELMVWHPGHDPNGPFIHDLWSSVAINPNVPHVDGRQIYINHMAPLTGPMRAWAKQYCDARRFNDKALGGMLCHWPDNNVGEEANIYKQSPVYPALLAFSERLWRGSNRQRADLYAQNPVPGDPDRGEWMNFERDMVSHRDNLLGDLPFDYIKHSHIPWQMLGPFKNGEEPSDPLKADGWSATAYGGTITLRHKFGFESFTAQQTGTVFAKTQLVSDKDQELTVWIGFEDFSRSGGRRGGPSPSQGQWTRHSSEVFVNGVKVDPPVWKQPNVGVLSKEISFVDELYWIREPMKIKVKKGLNQVLIKNVHKDAGFGWTFTFLPVDLTGTQPREVEGISWKIG